MNTQKKQLIIATITVLIFCAVTITGLFLLPILPSSAASVGGDDYSDLPAPAYIVAPKKVEGLVYNGRPQALITAGQDDITYSLESDGEFTHTIPTKLNAGVYSVYYKVADDDMVYSLHSTIAKRPRTVEVEIEDWNCEQTANEPKITLLENDSTTEPQITYYQNGQKLYRKPTAVGQYTVEVYVPEGTNYGACTASQDFTINSQIELLFDASLVKYRTLTITLGTQTQTVAFDSSVIISNGLNGTQALTVTADGRDIFKRKINAGQNQPIIVEEE